jgi:hypothetical protein
MAKRISLVVLVLCSIAAFAATTIVSGSGSGFLDSATQEAIQNMRSRCWGGQLSNVQTVSVTNDNGYYTVEMVATCNRSWMPE